MKLDAETAVKLVGPKYIQHNPTAPDGIEGFNGFTMFFEGKIPQLQQ